MERLRILKHGGVKTRVGITESHCTNPNTCNGLHALHYRNSMFAHITKTCHKSLCDRFLPNRFVQKTCVRKSSPCVRRHAIFTQCENFVPNWYKYRVITCACIATYASFTVCQYNKAHTHTSSRNGVSR